MTNSELVEKAGPFEDGNTPEAERAFWLARAVDVIDRKTKIMQGPDYQDYGCNWLLLWDRLFGFFFPFRYVELLRTLSTRYWTQQKAFDLIVLECGEFKDFAMLSRDGIKYLRSNQA